MAGLIAMMGRVVDSTMSQNLVTYPWYALSGGDSASIAAAIVSPFFLGFGFITRLAALSLLALAVFAEISQSVGSANLCRIALLTWYVLQGGGFLSLDRLLRHGLVSSAVPLAPQLVRATALLSRASRPGVLVGLRVWVAATLIEPHLPMNFGRLADIAMIPAGLAFVIAASLILGLAVPVSSAALLIFASGATLMAGQNNISMYFSLVLALLAFYGGGAWTLDAVLSRVIRGRETEPRNLPHVVVVGAGFGGMACVAGLRFVAVRVTLVDRRNFHLFQPLLYQVATGSLSPADIAIPIRGVLRDQPKVRVIYQTVVAVDHLEKRVITEQGHVPYDFLVIATGASHGYFEHPEWARHAKGLKSVEDAIGIRRQVLLAFEQAENAAEASDQRRLMTFIVCGGGPTGVELAGALAELARNGLQQEFRSIDPANAKIILVQSGPRLLPTFDDKLAEAARRALSRLGVEVRLQSRVESVDQGGATINGEYIGAGVVLWAAGVVASPAARWLGLEGDKAGRVLVGSDLSVPGRYGVYAIGDTALSLAWNGRSVPGIAPGAKQGGAYVAKVIESIISGTPMPSPFRYRHRGNLATIGRKAAVADFGALRVHGATAWWMWGTIHLFFLLGTRNRIAVGIGWIWSYFTYETAVQLITEDQAPN